MVMSESEIVREYRTAKNKPKQIAVLAELNAVKPDWIKDNRGGEGLGRALAAHCA